MPKMAMKMGWIRTAETESCFPRLMILFPLFLFEIGSHSVRVFLAIHCHLFVFVCELPPVFYMILI